MVLGIVMAILSVVAVYVGRVLLKRNVWIVASVGYLLVFVFSTAFRECFDKTGCITDPCKHEWRVCTLVAINQPYFIALSTIGLGGVIAWWYQRANKLMEFRFNTFE